MKKSQFRRQAMGALRIYFNNVNRTESQFQYEIDQASRQLVERIIKLAREHSVVNIHSELGVVLPLLRDIWPNKLGQHHDANKQAQGGPFPHTEIVKYVKGNPGCTARQIASGLTPAIGASRV